MSERDGRKVTQRLRDAILRLQYLPGQNLDETELSEKLGVSRTPVREAIGQLEGRRLVERRPAPTWLHTHQARVRLQRLLNGRPVELFGQVQEGVRLLVGRQALRRSRGRCAPSAGRGSLRDARIVGGGAARRRSGAGEGGIY